MATRASWKGHLKVGDLVCGVGLYTAVSVSDRISFNIVNRKTGHRVERQFVDSETGKPVERDDQVKGYRLDSGDYLLIEGEELAEFIPESDKLISVQGFVPDDEINKLYFDRPYYLAPVSDDDGEALALIARAMREQKVAAIGEAVLFRKRRTVLIRPQDDCIVATTLNYDYEVRNAETVFKDIPEIQFDKEMIELAGHIIGTKKGTFNPKDYDDRYEAALAALVQAKVEGRAPPKHKAEPKGKVIDLMEALRESARIGGKTSGKAVGKAPAKSGRGSDGRSKKAG
jgi:DNA end-binding protein Ku